MNWFIPEPHPDPNRPNLLVYSSCHVFGIMRYLNEYRAAERRQYNVSAVVVHIAAADPLALTNPTLLSAFHNADFLLHHPLASQKWAGFRAEEIGLKPSCVKVAMESPQNSAFWPVCGHTGEWPVRELIEDGLDASAIIQRFDSGQFDCLFRERIQEESPRMFEREINSDLKAAQFVDDHWREQKMFFTENHPTMPVLGYMVDQFLGILGHAEQGVDAALALPLATEEGGNHYPETDYEWDFYGFKYPKQFADAMGGSRFYHDRIRKIVGL